MSELAERARLLVSGLAKGTFEAEKTVPYCDLDSALGLSFAMPLIEQALLAERRLAMEEAAKIAEDEPRQWLLDAPTPQARIAAKLRFAAEGK